MSTTFAALTNEYDERSLGRPPAKLSPRSAIDRYPSGLSGWNSSPAWTIPLKL